MFIASCRHLLKGLSGIFVNKTMVARSLNCSTVTNILDVEVNRIVWIDMEMTGLDIEKDKIMEVACIITDADLNVVTEGHNIVIGHHESVLSNMNEWCIKQHGKTGLTDACLNSTVTMEQAESILVEFVKEHIAQGHSPLAGSSVYMDRLFLKKFMPKLDSYLHYRIIDVSTIKELCRRWNPDLYRLMPKKEFTHRALDDIKESIEELSFYKKNFFIVR